MNPKSTEPLTEPILGTYFSGNVAHHAVQISGYYMRTLCKPESAVLMGLPTNDKDSALCTYCKAGASAPVTETTKTLKSTKSKKPANTTLKSSATMPSGEKDHVISSESAPAKTQKAAKEAVRSDKSLPTKTKTQKLANVTVQPETSLPAKDQVEPEAPLPTQSSHVRETLDLRDACTNLLEALEKQPNVIDAKRGLDILETFQNRLRMMLPRRKAGTTTGTRSGMVSQASSFTPGPLFDQVKNYASKGDKRAQDIVAHALAYKPGVNCSYCIEHYGVEKRHQAALGFCSIGRELKSMELRERIQEEESRLPSITLYD